MRRRMVLVITVVGIASVALVVLTLGLSAQAAPERAAVAAASDVPGVVSYQGYLTDGSDQPIDGTVTLEFGIYAASSGGSPIWDETHNSVSVSAGYFDVLLGSTNPLNAAVFDGPTRYLQVAVNTGGGPVVMPRQQLATAPYAFQAQEAVNAWALNGNGGTLGSNFLGTSDNVTLTLKVSNTIAMRIAASGLDGIPNLIGGFEDNRVTAGVEGATIGGGGYLGHPNWVDADFATISGGSDNWARGEEAAIGGGTCNLASGAFAAISGGICNEASGAEAFVGGGIFNDATGDNAAIGGGDGNLASGELSTVGGGDGSVASAQNSTVGGGWNNRADGLASTVSGGSSNRANALTVAIGGGTGNNSNGSASTIAGGQNNTIANGTAFAAIGGGTLNLITGTAWYGTIGGGTDNEVSGSQSTVGGGSNNDASGERASVGGGDSNSAGGDISTVSGGLGNEASGVQATVGGGGSNSASAYATTVAGGEGNLVAAGANYATIGGGGDNVVTATATYGAIGGGIENTIAGSALYATIPGGFRNYVSGQFGFAAGARARVEHAGTFVWADSFGDVFTSTADHQFLIRATNGVGVGTNSPSHPLEMASGAYVSAGGVWTNSSDREKKENFSPVNPQVVLEEIASLPITRWNYKENPGVEHIGPVAQDFYAAFGLGSDERAIGTVDADGVALAAVQGLYEIAQEQEAQIEALQRQNTELETRLLALEKAALEKATDNGGTRAKASPGDWLRSLAPLAGLLFVGLVVQRRRPWRGGR